MDVYCFFKGPRREERGYIAVNLELLGNLKAKLKI